MKTTNVNFDAGLLTELNAWLNVWLNVLLNVLLFARLISILGISERFSVTEITE
jgi:hypothetical protein